jgi:HK97 family phage major capsid protein
MKVVSQLDEARLKHGEAIEKMEEWDDRIQSAPDDISEEEIEFFRKAFRSSQAEAKRWEDTVERLEVIVDAKRAIKPDQSDDDDNSSDDRHLQVRGVAVVNEPLTYRRGSPHSFFRDLGQMKSDAEAAKRINRHQEEMRVEKRDLTTGDPGGGGVIPPLYLTELLAELPRAARPVADAAPKLPLPASGMSIDIPKIQTGAAVAIQASENAGVQETDLDTETVTVNIRTMAGQNDVSRQLFERSMPGIDQIIFNDLIADYDQKLDTSLLSGAGSSGTHLGVRAVTGKITVTYTDASPTSAELLPKIYDAIQQVSTNRYMPADTIVMHPRRAAWLASNLSSTFPLFQLGALTQASGVQDNGFVSNIAGLRVILDPNIGALYGAGTNEDEIYVLRLADLYLMEGDVRTRVFEDVGSNTLTIRLQVFGYSAWVSARQPKSIAVVSGTGLAAPTF